MQLVVFRLAAVVVGFAPALLGNAIDVGHSEMTEDPHKQTGATTKSALERARDLQAPEPTLSYGGEDEHGEWWDAHDALFQQARLEWGQKHPQLYNAFDDDNKTKFLDPDLVRAIQRRNRTLFASLFEETIVPSVYTFRLFTPMFVEMLLQELDHHEASGIPLRRPNGMNRFGSILSELGFSEMVESLVKEYLVPTARYLFPETVGPQDVTHHYSFMVRYRPGQDVSLSEHSDASTVTVNVCLQPSSKDQKVLYFKEPQNLWWKHPKTASSKENTSNEPTYLELAQPGQAVVHLGYHTHGVSPVRDTRSQMVIWMFGEHGYVRVAPYESEEVQRHEREYHAFWMNDISSDMPKHEDL